MTSQLYHLKLRTSPHLKGVLSTDLIMRHVIYALIPASLFSIYLFGISAFMVLFTGIFSCLITERFLSKKIKGRSTLADGSAVITGLLLGMTLPPGFPLWMVFMGGVISIALGKSIFGGLGFNVFNPALVGRAVLQAAFPVAITTWSKSLQPDRFTNFIASTWTPPLFKPTVDAVTAATPLGAFKFDSIRTPIHDMILGVTGGSTGETMGVLLLLGGLYLAARKMLNWRIPVSILGTAFILTFILYQINPEKYPSPLFTIFAGGMMLGAIFMATDMVSSPITPRGVWIYGAIIGTLIVVIRIWGGLPEGVMYSILLGNALAPLIDRVNQPRVFGTKLKSKSAPILGGAK